MKVFIDANVLVTVLNKEYPCFPYSSRILSIPKDKGIELYTSPICLAIAFYFAEKKSGTSTAKRKIALLHSNINVSPVERDNVKNCIENKKINDFEDGLEYYSALEVGCNSIVTEDTKDFYFSDIEVLKSEDFVKKYFQQLK